MNPFALQLSEASVIMEGTPHPELAEVLRIGSNEIERLQLDNDKLRKAIELQGRAAITGMNAAKEISSHQLAAAQKLNAESKPEVIESERAANAILTARVEELERALHQIRNGCVDEGDTANELWRLSPSEIRKIVNEVVAR